MSIELASISITEATPQKNTQYFQRGKIQKSLGLSDHMYAQKQRRPHPSANNYRNSTEEEEGTLYNLYKLNPVDMYMPYIRQAVCQSADICKENSFFYYYG